MRPVTLRAVLISCCLLLVATCLQSRSARAEKWALVIGIAGYEFPDQVNPLTAADDDARAVARALTEAAGFPEENVLLLTSDGPVKPTGNNILVKVEYLARRARPGDTVFVYYSGHGLDLGGKPYLLPYDTDIRTDVTLRRTALATETLTEEIGRLPATGLFLAFELCRTDPRKGSRGVSQDNNLSGAQVRGLDFAAVAAAGSGNGDTPSLLARPVVTLFSCSQGERSYAWQDKGRGYFSHFLELGLRGKGSAPKKDGDAAPSAAPRLRARDLVTYLEGAVREAVQRDVGKTQTPFAVLRGTGAADLLLSGEGTDPATIAALTAEDEGASRTARFRAAMRKGADLLEARRYDAARLKFEEALEIDSASEEAKEQLAKARGLLASPPPLQSDPDPPSLSPAEDVAPISSAAVAPRTIPGLWSFKKQPYARATYAPPQGISGLLQATVTLGDTQRPDCVTLSLANLALEPGRTYLLRLRARASTGGARRIPLTLRAGNGTGQPAGLNRLVPLVPNWQALEYTFTVTELIPGPPCALVLEVGAVPGTVMLSDITLTEVKG